MNPLFILCGNQIVNRDQVTGVEYIKNESGEPNRDGHYAKCTVYTVDGRSVVYWDDQAVQMWAVFESSALSVTPA